MDNILFQLNAQNGINQLLFVLLDCGVHVSVLAFFTEAFLITNSKE
jgi:hypothetical protein